VAGNRHKEHACRLLTKEKEREFGSTKRWEKRFRRGGNHGCSNNEVARIKLSSGKGSRVLQQSQRERESAGGKKVTKNGKIDNVLAKKRGQKILEIRKKLKVAWKSGAGDAV